MKATIAILTALALALPAAGLSTTHNQTQANNVNGETMDMWNSIWAPFGLTNAPNILLFEPFGVSGAGVLVADIVADGSACLDGEVKHQDCGNDLTNQPFFRNALEAAGGLGATECEAVVDLDPNGTGRFGYNYTGSLGGSTSASEHLFFPVFSLYWNMGLLANSDEGPMMLLEGQNATGELSRSWQSFFTYEGVGTANEVHFTSKMESSDCTSFAIAPPAPGITVARSAWDMELIGHDSTLPKPFKDTAVTAVDHTVYTI